MVDFTVTVFDERFDAQDLSQFANKLKESLDAAGRDGNLCDTQNHLAVFSLLYHSHLVMSTLQVFKLVPNQVS